MDSKKPGVLKHLRQKMHPLLPSVLRNKTKSNKDTLQIGKSLDHRMSFSVPDMRDMREDYAPLFSRAHIQKCDISSYSNPLTPLNTAGGGQAGGSGLRMGEGRSEHGLSTLIDCTDWNSSRHSQSNLCAEDSRLVRNMEPEELGLPERLTIYSPDGPPGDRQQYDPNQDLNGQMGNDADNQTFDTGGESPAGSENVRELQRSFLLTINLKEGRNLVIRDRCGTSDPYVKFKLDGKTFYKSKVVYKNLNPKWNETFSLPVKDLNQNLYVKVYDRDLTSDDFMGSATVILSDLEIDKLSELFLPLHDPDSQEEDMGLVLVDMTLSLRDGSRKKGIVWQAPNNTAWFLEA